MRRYFSVQGQLRSIIVLLWPEVKFTTWLPRSKSICVVASWKEKHDAAQINPLSFLVRKLFAKKKAEKHLKIATYFTLTRPGGVNDLKRSTRVMLDSERPNDSFSLCPTALSQLEAKWHGGGNPPMCVLGWGNSVCGRGLRTNIFVTSPLYASERKWEDSFLTNTLSDDKLYDKWRYWWSSLTTWCYFAIWELYGLVTT